MNHIYPINEFLGVSTHLDNLAIQVIDKIQDNIDKPVRIKKHGVDVVIKSACQIKLPFQGKMATINLQFGDRPINGAAAFVETLRAQENTYEFKLYTSLLQIPIIVHELKHIDRIIARNFETKGYFYINHVGIDVVEHLPKSLFSNSTSENNLKASFYYLDPEEFEAYYNEIYRYLKFKIPTEIDRDEKIKVIKRLLNNKNVFKLYKYHFRNGGFNLNNYFVDKDALNYFLKLFNKKLDDYDFNDNYQNWNINIDDVKITNNTEKLINHLLTKQVFKGYRKFTRYYSIFL